MGLSGTQKENTAGVHRKTQTHPYHIFKVFGRGVVQLAGLIVITRLFGRSLAQSHSIKNNKHFEK
jgi:hypothetical protein